MTLGPMLGVEFVEARAQLLQELGRGGEMFFEAYDVGDR